MFDLKQPCMDCPFRIGMGSGFGLGADRLHEIVTARAFQCHKTVDYGEDDQGEWIKGPGDKPQQCAGLMAVLHRVGQPNQIMQVAQRLGVLDPATLDPRGEAYGSVLEAVTAHVEGVEP